MPDIRDGQTATNPTTGQRVVYHGGAWLPMKASAPPAGVPSDVLSRRMQGQPVLEPQLDPTRVISDPKERDRERGRLLSAGQAFLAKNQGSYNDARSQLDMLDQFDRLNDRIRPTGGVLNHVGNWVREKLGDADLNSMEQLSQNMARHQRQPGEGAVSDFEGRIFQKMVGGADKPYETNVRFSRAARAIAQRHVQQHEFQSAFLQANGHLVGWQEPWSRYRDANPVLDQDGNPQPVPSWQQWISNRARNVQAGRRPDGLPKVPPASVRQSASRPGGGWSVSQVP